MLYCKKCGRTIIDSKKCDICNSITYEVPEEYLLLYNGKIYNYKELLNRYYNNDISNDLKDFVEKGIGKENVIFDTLDRKKQDLVPDFVGIQVPNEFVVGYGLDYKQKYRNLPYIGVLKPEVYTDPEE